jgi:hypothetical protein
VHFAVLKKLILAAALLVALASGKLDVSALSEQPAAAKEPCVVGLSCPSLDSLQPAW